MESLLIIRAIFVGQRKSWQRRSKPLHARKKAVIAAKKQRPV
jgi:hypothetical protein